MRKTKAPAEEEIFLAIELVRKEPRMIYGTVSDLPNAHPGSWYPKKGKNIPTQMLRNGGAGIYRVVCVFSRERYPELYEVREAAQSGNPVDPRKLLMAFKTIARVSASKFHGMMLQSYVTEHQA